MRPPDNTRPPLQPVLTHRASLNAPIAPGHARSTSSDYDNSRQTRLFPWTAGRRTTTTTAQAIRSTVTTSQARTATRRPTTSDPRSGRALRSYGSLSRTRPGSRSRSRSAARSSTAHAFCVGPFFVCDPVEVYGVTDTSFSFLAKKGGFLPGDAKGYVLYT